MSRPSDDITTPHRNEGIGLDFERERISDLKLHQLLERELCFV